MIPEGSRCDFLVQDRRFLEVSIEVVTYVRAFED